MKLSFSTGSLYGMPLDGVFSLVAAAGFEGVELVVAPEVLGRGPAGVRARAEAHGLVVNAVHPSLVRLPGWKEHGGGMRKLVDLALALGAPTVVIHPPRRVTSLADPLARRFARTVDAAVKAGAGTVTLAVENPSRRGPADEANPFTRLATLQGFAADHGLGLTLDTSHAGSFGHDLLAAYAAHFRGRLRNLHLSDYRPGSPLVDNRLLANHLVEHQMPGTGGLPLRALIGQLAADGYAGNLSVEVGPIPLRAWWLPTLRRKLVQMAAFVASAREARAPAEASREPLRLRRSDRSPGPGGG